MAEQPMGLLSDDLTPDERKYFETGGESGLPEPPAGREPEPAPQPEPAAAAPEPPPEPDEDEPEPPDPQTGKAPPRRVPLRRFRALEDQYKSANQELTSTRQRLQELETTLARADERFLIINEALATTPAVEEQPAPELEDPRPDPRTDVFAYMEWLERQYARTQDENARMWQSANEQLMGVSNRTQSWEDEQQYQRDVALLDNAFRADAQTYASSNPRFAHAYVYLMNMRDRQYQTLGMENPRDRNNQIMAEERQIVAAAYNAGINPAERVYQLAVASGFNPDAVPNASGAAASAPAGAAPPGASPGGAPRFTGNVAAEIAAARNGQRAALSLSQGGGAPANQLTPELLANMPEAEFGRLIDHLQATNPARLRELLPGA